MNISSKGEFYSKYHTRANYGPHWARIEFRFFDELPQEWMGDIKLGLKVYGKQESFKS